MMQVFRNGLNVKRRSFLTIVILTLTFPVFAQQETIQDLNSVFANPPEDAKPWVYWYWMHSAVTEEGIAADLAAMKKQGIGGAYLMTVEKTSNPPYISPPAAPLSPQWWRLIKFTMSEADRLGVKLGMTPCDGWALAGGPWITPETSMQKVVWAKTIVKGGSNIAQMLKRPEDYKGFYKDIAVYAYRTPEYANLSTAVITPEITSNAEDKNFTLLSQPNNKKDFSTEKKCWIEYKFQEPFNCRSIIIKMNRTNYQAERFIVETSNDGANFKRLERLKPPRHGWQDRAKQVTYSIPPTSAKYFRFIYDPEGSEPGSEDLDFAKFKPELKLCGIELSAEPFIHQFEGKNGQVWRISEKTTKARLPDNLCIPKQELINLTNLLSPDGLLNWNAPPGDWTILRMGHTSTGFTNAHAGTATGLECDKFDPRVAKIQFDGWFGEAIKQCGSELAKKVLNIFHVDSWECGSQNWSSNFSSEFKKRRGYELMDYLPVMAGVPIDNAETSERVLNDVRQTITELTTDNFFGTLKELAHEKGCKFSAEAVAPTMSGDGMLHFKNVDIPMGEFWFRSPTHDKPNDMLDAISGGHIYGKNIIQSESFTELRLMWDEHPAMLKATTDRNFALGINRFALHVNTHNPFIDRKPGVGLDGIGLFFQRDQTWWKPGKGWIDYIQRCQSLLQQGKPVVDIAVFTGEEIPRRALLPDRLVSTLPGIFGRERVQQEKIRLENKNIPMREGTEGFMSTANMTAPENWVDPLRGYLYDSFNKDALLRLAKVENGRIVLPSGASYGLFVIPRAHPMSPDSTSMSVEVLEKLNLLAKQGATIIFNGKPIQSSGMGDDKKVIKLTNNLLTNPNYKILKGIYTDGTFDKLKLYRDVIVQEISGEYANDIAWTHRKGKGFDLYFISNQKETKRQISVSLREGGNAELWDALSGEIHKAKSVYTADKRTLIPLSLDKNGSVFIVLRKDKSNAKITIANWPDVKTLETLPAKWNVTFNAKFAGPENPVVFMGHQDWSKRPEENIKHYSGSATYTQRFNWNSNDTENMWLEFDKVENLAQVYINGIDCGVAWTSPYRVNISKAIKKGANSVKIEVTNTWANRLIGDAELPEDKRTTWTSKSPINMKGRPLLPAGILGSVKIVTLK